MENSKQCTQVTLSGIQRKAKESQLSDVDLSLGLDSLDSEPKIQGK